MLVAVREPLTLSANPKANPCETSKLLNSSSRKWGRYRSVRSRPVGNVAAVREAAKTILLEQDPPYHKKDSGLFPHPPSPTSKRWCLGYIAPILSGGKAEKKRFKLLWIVSLAMQASCKQNINGSFQILRLINFVHVVHHIGSVLYTPPPPSSATKHGRSSSSTLVMTTSLIRSSSIGSIP